MILRVELILGPVLVNTRCCHSPAIGGSSCLCSHIMALPPSSRHGDLPSGLRAQGLIAFCLQPLALAKTDTVQTFDYCGATASCREKKERHHSHEVLVCSLHLL